MPLPSEHQAKHALKMARSAARPYWGTIVGSAVGLALAGPFGLLAGAGFGYWLHDAPAEGIMPPMGPPPGWEPPPPGEYQEATFKADELQKVEPPPPPVSG